MRILLVEDEKSFALEVEMLLSEMGYELIGVVDNAQEAMMAITKEQPDLILMDIGIKGELSGVDVAERIKHKKIPLIFVTAFNDFPTYNRASTTNPFGFIVKPFDRLTLQSAIQVVFNKMYKDAIADEDPAKDILTDDGFFVKYNQELKKIKFSEILWIKSDGNYVDIITEDKKYAAKISLTKIEEKLQQEDLVRVHKSFIVNSRKILSINNATNEIMVNEDHIPYGRKYKSELMKRIAVL